MLSRIVHAAVMSVVALFAAGCGQSSPTAGQTAGDDNKPAAIAETAAHQELQSPADHQQKPGDSQIKQATAQSPLGRTDDQVKPAVATAPVAELPAEPAEPAALAEEETGPLPLEEPLDSGLFMPQVFLTEAHAKTCLLRVGDPFPKLELADLDGQQQSFSELLGEKLTIVVFWSGKLPSALEELADMQSRFLGEFGEQGVAVVGVNVGDEPQLAAELVEQTGAKFPNLSDAGGTAFGQVATENLPRTYLIDTSGKVLWFDLEYSRSTRQQLLSALRFALKTEAPQ